MNPAVLYPSRFGNLVQLLFFLGLAALALWLLIDFSGRLGAAQTLPPPAATYPDPTPGILFDETLALHRDEPGPGETIRFLILPIISIPVLLWLATVRVRRLFSGKPLGEVANGKLILRNGSTCNTREIPLSAIRSVLCDRADRVKSRSGVHAAGVGALGARLGARLRWSLQITCSDRPGEDREVRISDLEVEGGREQLAGFVEYLTALAGLAKQDPQSA